MCGKAECMTPNGSYEMSDPNRRIPIVKSDPLGRETPVLDDKWFILLPTQRVLLEIQLILRNKPNKKVLSQNGIDGVAL